MLFKNYLKIDVMTFVTSTCQYLKEKNIFHFPMNFFKNLPFENTPPQSIKDINIQTG